MSTNYLAYCERAAWTFVLATFTVVLLSVASSAQQACRAVLVEDESDALAIAEVQTRAERERIDCERGLTCGHEWRDLINAEREAERAVCKEELLTTAGDKDITTGRGHKSGDSLTPRP